MPQYFADIKETEFFLTQDEAHHAAAVARHKEGDEITVFDGTGRQYIARIDKVQKKFVRGTLLRACQVRRVSPAVSLYFVPNSRCGLEDVLDKGTQLGVAAFCPVISARSEYDVLTKWEQKAVRWQQIMRAACKQCNTPFIPALLPPQPFAQAVALGGPALLAYEAEPTHTLAWGMEQLGNPQTVRIFIGPAGGWTEDEVALAARHQVHAVTLGINILRAETACIAAVAKLV